MSDLYLVTRTFVLYAKEGYKHTGQILWMENRLTYIFRIKKIEGNKIWNQTIDHYSMVIGLNGWFITHDIPVLELNHAESWDLLVEICEKKWAIKYERPGIHKFEKLVAKKETIENAGASPVFICQHGNLDEV